MMADATTTALHKSTYTKRISHHTPRALPPDIRAKIKEKQLLLKVWQRSRRPMKKTVVNKTNAQVTLLINAYTKDCLRRTCDELGKLRSSSNAYWKRLTKANLSNEKPRTRLIHKLRLADGTISTD